VDSHRAIPIGSNPVFDFLDAEQFHSRADS
jgi:hypothetical protein